MIAVIFEVIPAPGCRQHYLDLAAALKLELGTVDGFISVERFQSLSDPDKMLSLSFFRDEQAVTCWRNTAAHRASQARGRATVFADYRLRVAEVARDYGMFERAQVPLDSRRAAPAPTSRNRGTGRADPVPKDAKGALVA
jgi:heme-degrading monooxygenase HmoA